MKNAGGSSAPPHASEMLSCLACGTRRFIVKDVTIYTDGACLGNPGPGGWAAILVFGEHQRELSGGSAETTNNRMELTGAIESLSALKEPCRVRLVSDSRYLVDAFEKRWVYRWRENGWRKKDKSPALNADLWERLVCLFGVHDVTLHWVRGHSGHAFNERCDALAVSEAQRYKETAQVET